MLSKPNPYSVSGCQVESEGKAGRCWVVVVCILGGVFVSALVVSIWLASLIDYSEISSTKGANIGAGVAIVSLGFFAVSVFAIVLIAAMFYALSHNQPQHDESLREEINYNTTSLSTKVPESE